MGRTVTRRTAPPRYTYLDLLRGLAALAVIVVHYRWFYASTPGDWTRSFTQPLPLAGALRPIFDHGGFAVQLFWLLSGTVFVLRYGDGRYDKVRFWVWRFARLYPLHLATLLLISVIQLVSIRLEGRTTVYANFDLYHFVLQLFMASAWGAERGDSFNGPIWSVSLEVMIYAAFFAYTSMRRATLISSLAIAVVFTAAWLVLRTGWAQCGSLFFIGCALPPLLRQCEGRLTAGQLLGCAAAGPMMLLSASWFATGPAGIYLPDPVYFYTLLPVLILSALVFDLHLPPITDRLAWIGAITYSTYLLHMPILISLKLWFDMRPDRAAILASPVTLSVYVTIVVVAALFVHRTFERPAQLAIQRRYDAYRRRSGRAPSGSSSASDA